MQSSASFIIRRIKAKKKKRKAKQNERRTQMMQPLLLLLAAFKDSHLIQMNFIFSIPTFPSLALFVCLWTMTGQTMMMMPNRFMLQIPPLLTTNQPPLLCALLFSRFEQIVRFPTPNSGTNKWVARSHSLTQSSSQSFSQSVSCASVRRRLELNEHSSGSL